MQLYVTDAEICDRAGDIVSCDVWVDADGRCWDNPDDLDPEHEIYYDDGSCCWLFMLCNDEL